jgi:hypothetical protein
MDFQSAGLASRVICIFGQYSKPRFVSPAFRWATHHPTMELPPLKFVRDLPFPACLTSAGL